MRRAIGAMVAAAAVMAAAAPGALAATASLRVEAPTSSSGLVQRTAVDLSQLQPVTRTVTTTSGGTTTSTSITCPAGSAISVLDKVTGGNWTPTATSTTAADLGIAKIAAGPDVAFETDPAKAPRWVAYIGGTLAAHPCTDVVPGGKEALFYPQCAANPNPSTMVTACFPDGPLFLRLDNGDASTGDFWAVGPVNIGFGNPLRVWAMMTPLSTGSFPTPAPGATLSTDMGLSVTIDPPATGGLSYGYLRFDTQGPHLITLREAGHVPDRLPVCATNGADGYCGTTLPAPPPFDVDQFPAPCTTNGHDGLCGTTDTSGPGIAFTNLANGQVFHRSARPTGFKGTIVTDPNGVKRVQMRLTRVVTVRVPVKHKKKHPKKHHKRHGSKHRRSSKHPSRHATSRSASAAKATKHHGKHHHKHSKHHKHKVRYRTVKHCSHWSDATYLIEKSKHCGTAHAPWFDVDTDDPPTTWHYGFAMKLPRGTYTIEMKSEDYLGNTSASEPGKTLLTFVVQ